MPQNLKGTGGGRETAVGRHWLSLAYLAGMVGTSIRLLFYAPKLGFFFPLFNWRDIGIAPFPRHSYICVKARAIPPKPPKEGRRESGEKSTC